MKAEELFHEEKLALLSYMDWRTFPFPQVDATLQGKNAETSKNLRKAGNLIYAEKFHTVDDCEKMWNLYTECIAFAPSDSEELALGYGNRSAFLFRSNAYEPCILDCDRALSVTKSSHLRMKLLCRKVKSLAKLHRSTEEVSREALNLLDKLTLDEKNKNHYKAQLTHELSSGSSSSSSSSSASSVSDENEISINGLLEFERSQEVPCASKSVAIEYNEKWGRHVVATEDIQPGEIIAIGKSCLNFPRGSSKHQFCGNCMKYLFVCSCIPCEYCAYNVYCNESCRKEAWEKYHQFECCIIIILQSNEAVLDSMLHYLRMCLCGIYEAGGLKQMKEQLLEIENTKDARKKGFSNGIFEEGKIKTALGLQFVAEFDIKWLRLGVIAYTVYLLAKYTTFFGKKMNVTESNIFRNKDRLFIAALVLRCYYICTSSNMHKVTMKNESEVQQYYLNTFGSIFNHSCDPNVTYCSTQYCKNIYYARYPIQKGSQLFIAYHHNTFLNKSKKSRQEELGKYFTCECTACKENWSSICLPSLKVVLQIIPSLRTSTLTDIVKAGMKQVDPTGQFGPLTQKRESILLYLDLLSKNFTVYCQEYFSYLKFLNDIYSTFDIQYNLLNRLQLKKLV